MPAQALPKKPTNLSLDQELLNDAKSLGINLSKAAETGLISAIAQAKSELWKQQNASAIKSANEWVVENGLPLEKFRQF